MAKEDRQLGFGDLSWVLKGAVIAGWIYLVMFVISLVYTLMTSA